MISDKGWDSPALWEVNAVVFCNCAISGFYDLLKRHLGSQFMDLTFTFRRQSMKEIPISCLRPRTAFAYASHHFFLTLSPEKNPTQRNHSSAVWWITWLIFLHTKPSMINIGQWFIPKRVSIAYAPLTSMINLFFHDWMVPLLPELWLVVVLTPHLARETLSAFASATVSGAADHSSKYRAPDLSMPWVYKHEMCDLFSERECPGWQPTARTWSLASPVDLISSQNPIHTYLPLKIFSISQHNLTYFSPWPHNHSTSSKSTLSKP